MTGAHASTAAILDTRDRDAMVVRHIGLVHHVARQLLPSAGSDADLDDLVSAGTIGLLAALDTFDEGRGLAFSTYAATRIRGAILDDRRKRDHVPRSVRRKQRSVKDARETLREMLGREPSAAETAAALDMSLEDFFEWRDEIPENDIVSLDRPMGEPGSDRAAIIDVLVGDDGTGTEERINREEEIAILRERIADLGEQERTVLALYYYEELKLHEIAVVLGVSESRVSQIRSKAVRTLRTKMTGEAA